MLQEMSVASSPPLDLDQDSLELFTEEKEGHVAEFTKVRRRGISILCSVRMWIGIFQVKALDHVIIDYGIRKSGTIFFGADAYLPFVGNKYKSTPFHCLLFFSGHKETEEEEGASVSPR